MSQTYRVLILDDDAEDALSLTQKFARSDRATFAVKTALTLEDALVQMAEVVFDLVMIDFNLGDVTALEAMRSLADHGHLQPVLIVTGLATPERRQDAKDSGAFETLTKENINPESLGIIAAEAIHQAKEDTHAGRLVAIQRSMVTRQDHAALSSQVTLLLARVKSLEGKIPDGPPPPPESTGTGEVAVVPAPDAAPALPDPPADSPAWERVMARFEKNPVVYVLAALLVLVVILLALLHPELANFVGLGGK